MPSKAKCQFIVRKAELSDLPVLVNFQTRLALHVAGDPTNRLKEEERERLMIVLRSLLSSKDKRIVVAQAPNGDLLGMGYVHIFKDQGIWEQAGEVELKSAIIDDVWVEPDFRRLGVFTAMLRELVTFAEKHKAYELILEYATANKEAAATWTSLGFVPTGVRASAFTEVVQEKLGKRREPGNR